MKLSHPCLVENALTERTSATPSLRDYTLTPNEEVSVGFTLDSVPGGNGAELDYQAIGVQTHGVIDVGVDIDFTQVNVGQSIKLSNLSQPPTDKKMFNGIEAEEIGKVAGKIPKMACDKQTDFCRIRLKLKGEPLKVPAGP